MSVPALLLPAVAVVGALGKKETILMEPMVRELVGGDIKTDEVEKILRRLTKIREALARLDPLLDSSVEPLPIVVMEDR